jgi:hypothetical protein
VEESEPIFFVTGDNCAVQQLRRNAVGLFSCSMAQSVAFDSYSDMVDDLLANFERVDRMFRALGLNNAIVIEMMY